jgi:hypothetical protein
MQTRVCENDVHQQIIGKIMSGESHLSYSSLSAFKSSPADFITYKLGKREETEAMIYGSMVHCLVLEPDEFDKRYHCLDDKDICFQIGGAKPRATKAYKEWKEVAMAECGERILVDTEDYEHAKIVALNVRTNRASLKVLRKCPEREKGINWTYENFLFKGFIDLDGNDATADFKTVPDASPKKALRTILENGYHIQQAMYRVGLAVKKKHYIIAADKKGGVSVHLLDEKLMEHGLEQYNLFCKRFNDCIMGDFWNQSHDFWAERFDGIFVADKAAWMY